MDGLACLPDERVLHSSISTSCCCGEEVSCCCWLGLSWTVKLTNRRIATRVVKKLFGFSFYEKDESFRYKDLKHVSISMSVTYWKFLFSLTFLELAVIIVDCIRWLHDKDNGTGSNELTPLFDEPEAAGETSSTHAFSDPATDDSSGFYVNDKEDAEPSFGSRKAPASAMSPENDEDSSGFDEFLTGFVVASLTLAVAKAFVGLLLFAIGVEESFFFNLLALDFYKKERVESWLFTVFDGRFGSATTARMRFSPEQCRAIANALHEHQKTELSAKPPDLPSQTI